MKKPQNGPSLSKKPDFARPRVNATMHPSPDQRQAKLDQDARDSAKSRAFRENLTNGEFGRQLSDDVANGRVEMPRDMSTDEIATLYADKWKEICRKEDSMAYAEAQGSTIIVKYQRIDQIGGIDIRRVNVLRDCFEINGMLSRGFEMPEIVRDDIENHFRDYSKREDALARRRRARPRG